MNESLQRESRRAEWVRPVNGWSEPDVPIKTTLDPGDAENGASEPNLLNPALLGPVDVHLS